MHTWNRSTDALAFLARAKHLLETSPKDRQEPNRKKRKIVRRGKLSEQGKTKRNTQDQTIDLVTYDIVKDADPAIIRYGLETARAHVMAKDEGVAALLLAINRHCPVDSHALVLEGLDARSELLTLYRSEGKVFQKTEAFNEAWQAVGTAWAAYPWDVESFKSLEMMEACMKLAGGFLKAGFDQKAKDLFGKIEDKASAMDGYEEQTIWILISIGILY